MKILNLFITIILLHIGSQPLIAQTFVNAQALGANNGSSWTDAYTSLSMALDSVPVSGQVWVAAGTYLPGNTTFSTFLINREVELYGGFVGTEQILSQRDASTNQTILSGDLSGNDIQWNVDTNRADNVRAVLTINNSITNATIIDGFTITGGHQLNFETGAGIKCMGTPIVRNCRISDNYCRGEGAGLGLDHGSSQEVAIEDCVFEYNISGAFGGAIGYDKINNIPDVFINNCVFENNHALSVGGAIGFFSASCTIQNSLFTNNTTDLYGGAIGIAQFESQLETTVINCDFENNTAYVGGGIYLQISGRTNKQLIRDCNFIENHAVEVDFSESPKGGGLFLYQDTFMTDGGVNEIIHCLFEGNSSDEYGAAASIEMGSSGSEVNIDSCTFTENILTGPNPNVNATLNLYGFKGPAQFSVTNADFSRNQKGKFGALVIETGVYGNFRGQVSHCNFTENEADLIGGAISTIARSGAQFAKYEIDHCRFEKNRTTNTLDRTFGGAIAVSSGIDNFNLTINASEFTGNSSPNGGGAAIEAGEFDGIQLTAGSGLRIENSLFIEHDSARSTILLHKFPKTLLLNLTLADNDSHALVAENQAHMNVINCILHSPNADDVRLFSGTMTSLGGNLISDSSATSDLTPQDMEGVTPIFEGGMMHPYKNHFNSPAVDLGVFYGGFDPMSDKDILGLARLQGKSIDAGAYESPFTTAIEDILSPKTTLRMYPIPANDFLSLDIENSWRGEFKLQIYNVVGQKFLKHDVAKNQDQTSWKIDLRSLPAGSYQLVISNGKEAISKAFVKN